MQFKRDTDYALRILLCLAKQEELGTKLSVYDLSKETLVPATIASRLCKTMKEAKLVQAEKKSNGTIKYGMGKRMLNKTLYDVVQAIEGNINLFAVFDKRTELYVCCKDVFTDVGRQSVDVLKGITIRDLIEKEKNFKKASE